MSKIIYSFHLVLRLRFRGIPYSLPKIIYQDAKEYYFDKETFKRIAVKKIKFKNKLREIAVIYEEKDSQINLITIHPLKKHQKISRINSGRWQRIL